MKELAKVLLLSCIVLAVTMIIPEPVLAYDFKQGATEFLNFMATVVVIAIVVVATMSFIKGQMMAAIIAAVIGAVILAVANVNTLKALGEALIELFS